MGKRDLMRRGICGWLVAMLVLCGASGAWAGTKAITNTLSYSESLSQKVVNVKGQDLTWSSHLAAGDVYTVRAKMSLAGINVSEFSSATSCSISVGNLHVTCNLGDDPRYRQGKKSAAFRASFINGDGKTVGLRTVRLSWTSKQLNVSIAGRTTDITATGWASIGADTRIGQQAGPFSDTTSGAVSFSGTGAIFNPLPVAGRVTVRSAHGKDKTQYSPVIVKIKGSTKGGKAAVHVTVGDETPITSEMLGNQGGDITISSGALAGVTVEVPAGAVTGDTEFTVSQGSASLVPNSGTFPGQVISIHTDGQTSFEEPLRITVPFPDNGTEIPVPYYIDDNGHLEACQIVSIDHTAGTMTFETFHASLFTWLYSLIAGPQPGGHTSYVPGVDGFQIVNTGSTYNPGGECFGMCAFEQWLFKNHGGALYSKYMQDIPLPSSGTIKGQRIVATRAHTSVSRLWSTYWPRVAAELNMTAAERYTVIVNTLDNTAIPAMLYLSEGATSGTHAILAYDHNDSDTLFINDPNHPAQSLTIARDSFTYGGYAKITMIGDGTYQKEPFTNIYDDAESGFHGNGAAQVTVTSHTDGQHVTERMQVVSGTIESGQVLVDRLVIVLNGTTRFEQPVDLDGSFSIPVELATGENTLRFLTKGHDAGSNEIEALNTQLDAFKLIYDSPNSVILATLTWNTNHTDIDLYAIDPVGDYSCYYHMLTMDGGELDFDCITGFGPEHWTLTGTDTVRWGEDYTFRVHYYYDHTNDCPGPAVPTRWTVTILLYEGTQDAVTYTYSGVLSYHDADYNDSPGGSGASWAEVATIRPVQATPGASLTPVVSKGASGRPLITVPVPSRSVRLLFKSASESAGPRKGR